jgi:hypothetical protein
MKNRYFFLALASSALLMGSGPDAGAAQNQGRKGDPGRAVKAYKWVDKDGVTHYGDTVPPEYSEQGREELNSQGVPLREVQRQLSPAEAQVAQQKAADEQKRRQHDAFLLNTYTRVSDIEQVRDERVALIDGQMELARGTLAISDQRITALQARIVNFRPYSASPTARRLPDQLAEEVVRTLSERRTTQAQLQQREKEKAEQVAGFADDIARYKELTNRTLSR